MGEGQKILFRIRNRGYKNETVCRIMRPVNNRTEIVSGENEVQP